MRKFASRRCGIVVIFVTLMAAGIALAQPATPAEPKAAAASAAADVAARELEATRKNLAAVNASLDAVREILAGRAKPGKLPTTRLTGRPTVYISAPTPQSLGDVRFASLNWGHGSVIGSIRAPRQGAISPYDYTEERVRAYARLCRDGGFVDRSWLGQPPAIVIRGAPTVLDYEGYHDPNGELCPPERRRKDLTIADVARLFRKHLDWFRAEAPGVPVSVIGYNYLTPDDPEGKTFRTVHEACDFTNGGYYLLAHEWVDRDTATIRTDTARIRKPYPDKPLFFWINPVFTAERTSEWREGDTGYTHRKAKEITPDVAPGYVNAAAELGDAIVVWSDVPWQTVERVLGKELGRVATGSGK